MRGLLFALFLQPAVFAQTQVGLDGGILKSTQENARLFYGAEVMVKREVSEAVRGNVNLGIYQYTNVVVGSKVRSYAVPVSVGLDYSFLSNDVRPYLGVNAGLMIRTVNQLFGSASTFNPSISPVAGVDYQLNDHFGLNLNFKYSFVFYRDESTPAPDFISWMNPNAGVFYTF